MSEINKLMFREYDIRGRVNENEINENSCILIGKAYGTFCKRRNVNEVVVGYDSRTYSERLKDALVKGLISTGITVIDIGLSLTPIVYFAQYHYNTKGAAMVTASHNPNGWSGFKLADGFSSTLIADGVQEIVNLIENDDFEIGEGIHKKDDVYPAYKKEILSKIKIKKPLKVVVDCANGTAGAFSPQIFRELGCEVFENYCDLDPTFPNHFPNPSTPESREKLAERVKKENADIGICFDGDGDRLGVVDEKGNTIWSDMLLILMARQVLERKPNSKIVFDVKCSQAVEDEVKKFGGTPIMWKTGHSWIKRKCHEEKAAIGGEMSGHMFIMDNYYGFDDALFAAARVVEFLSSKQESLSQMMESIPKYFSTSTLHAECPDEVKYRIVDRLVEEFKKDYNVNDVNGARVLFGDGWGLVRASSNMPVLVLRFEAKSNERLEEFQKIFKEKMDNFTEIGKKWHTG